MAGGRAVALASSYLASMSQGRGHWTLPQSIKDRLEAAILEDAARSQRRTAGPREGERAATREFEPVRHAAEDIRDQLEALPSIKFAINPSDVWISLADRDLWIGYDVSSGSFLGIENSHAWVDGELYSDNYTWDSAEACVEAMIRFCARYVRMARVISGGEV